VRRTLPETRRTNPRAGGGTPLRHRGHRRLRARINARKGGAPRRVMGAMQPHRGQADAEALTVASRESSPQSHRPMVGHPGRSLGPTPPSSEEASIGSGHRSPRFLIPTGRPQTLDPREPQAVAFAKSKLVRAQTPTGHGDERRLATRSRVIPTAAFAGNSAASCSWHRVPGELGYARRHSAWDSLSLRSDPQAHRESQGMLPLTNDRAVGPEGRDKSPPTG